MGGFIFPSLPCGLLDNLLDTSPQVFYPAPKLHTRARSQSPRPSAPLSNPPIHSLSNSGLPVISEGGRVIPINVGEVSVGSGIGRSNLSQSHSNSIRTAPSSPRKPSPFSSSLSSIAFAATRSESPTPSLPPSISADDETGEWRPINRRKSNSEMMIHSRASSSRSAMRGVGGVGIPPSEGRHRRSQSALPPPTPGMDGVSRLHGSSYGSGGEQPNALAGPSRRGSIGVVGNTTSGTSMINYGPLGRLQEFSRNPLASTSAISLPTLTEMGTGQDHPGTLPSPSSPLVRPRHRPSSRASMVSITASASVDNEPPSPRIPKNTLHTGARLHGSLGPTSSSLSSSPPPARLSNETCEHLSEPMVFTSIDSTQTPDKDDPSFISSLASHVNTTSIAIGDAEMRGKRPNRPPMSPRSQSAHEIVSPKQTVFPWIQRRSSINAGSATTNSTSSVSDVAVMATWSFPPCPEATVPSQQHEMSHSQSESAEAGRIVQPSDRLRDRLRTLSTIDTSPPGGSSLCLSSSTSPVTLQPPPSMPPPPPPLFRHTRGCRLPPHMTHRHTLSTPNLLLVPGTSSSTFLSASGSISPNSLSSSVFSSESTLGVYSLDTSSKSSSPGKGAYQYRHPPRTLPPVPPGPRPKRPTTTRLRQPTQLSMPLASSPSILTAGSGGGNNGRASSIISSSPRSMVSDTSSICESIDSISFQRYNSSVGFINGDGDREGSGDRERSGRLSSSNVSSSLTQFGTEGKSGKETWWTSAWKSGRDSGNGIGNTENVSGLGLYTKGLGSVYKYLPGVGSVSVREGEGDEGFGEEIVVEEEEERFIDFDDI